MGIRRVTRYTRNNVWQKFDLMSGGRARIKTIKFHSELDRNNAVFVSSDIYRMRLASTGRKTVAENTVQNARGFDLNFFFL